MSFYPPNVLPRVELKFKAKSLLRGNWMILIAVTLLYLLLTGFQFTYNYGGTTETGPSLLSGQANNTMDYFQLYFQYSMSSLGTAVGNIGNKAGYNSRKWTKHGKLPYITYVQPEPDTDDKHEANKAKVKARFGFTDSTIKWLDSYKYNKDIMDKLANKG